MNGKDVKTLIIYVVGSNRYSNGDTFIMGESVTRSKDNGTEPIYYQVKATGPSGPELPPFITDYSRNEIRELSVVVKAEGELVELSKEDRTIKLENCVFSLQHDLPDKPGKFLKSTGLPTKKAKNEYDLLQRAYLGQEFQKAGLNSPHITADRIYNHLSWLSEKVPSIAKEVGTTEEPKYKQAYAKVIIRWIPRIFDLMKFDPKDTDVFLKYLGEYEDYKNSNFRYAAYGNYIMETLHGDTYMEKNAFLVLLTKVTGSELSPEEVMDILDACQSVARFEFADDRVFLTRIRNAEIEAAAKLKRLYRPFKEFRQEVVSPIDLSSEQDEAVRGICSLYNTGGVAVVTGGPGTGKTTILRAVLSTLRGMGVRDEDIALAAPTGKAAKRMEELSDFPASTIHRLLEVDAKLGIEYFKVNRDAPLEKKMVIIDESSMVDIALFRDILVALRSGTALVLMGDADQLQSVRPGAVFSELLETNQRILKFGLTYNFRQKKNSMITENAYRIINGYSSLEEDNSFEVIEVADKDEVMPIIQGRKDLNIIDDPESVIISFTNNDVWTFNKSVLDGLKESGRKSLTFENRNYYQKEKVIFCRNNYDHVNVNSTLKSHKAEGKPCPYYNGEIGFIKSMVTTDDKYSQNIKVKCPDKIVIVHQDDYSDLKPAYAITGHKTQGSEYNNVVIFISEYSNADRSWLYTAVTRARKKTVILSENGGIASCIERERRKRLTMFVSELKKNNLYDPENTFIQTLKAKSGPRQLSFDFSGEWF